MQWNEGDMITVSYIQIVRRNKVHPYIAILKLPYIFDDKILNPDNTLSLK